MLISCCRFGVTMQGSLMIHKLSANNTPVYFMLAFNFLLQKSWLRTMCVCIVLMAVESSVCGISGTCRLLKEYCVVVVCIYTCKICISFLLLTIFFRAALRVLILSGDYL